MYGCENEHRRNRSRGLNGDYFTSSPSSSSSSAAGKLKIGGAESIHPSPSHYRGRRSKRSRFFKLFCYAETPRSPACRSKSGPHSKSQHESRHPRASTAAAATAFAHDKRSKWEEHQRRMSACVGNGRAGKDSSIHSGSASESNAYASGYNKLSFDDATIRRYPTPYPINSPDLPHSSLPRKSVSFDPAAVAQSEEAAISAFLSPLSELYREPADPESRKPSPPPAAESSRPPSETNCTAAADPSLTLLEEQLSMHRKILQRSPWNLKSQHFLVSKLYESVEDEAAVSLST